MAAQKVVLITAGSAGLGAAVAKAFAPDFRVVINYANNSDRAKSLVEELRKISSTSGQAPQFEAIQADVGDRSAIERMAKDVVSRFGRLDVVVSNAGWTRVTNFMNLEEGMAEEDWDKCFLYNVKAHLWLFHAVKAELEKTDGAFITTASLAGTKVSGSSLPYMVTKSALIHLSKALAVIAAPNIRVNTLSPGLLMTDWGKSFSEEKRNNVLKGTKLKRFATVEDCADAVRLFATSQSITGQNIIVDSGTSL